MCKALDGSSNDVGRACLPGAYPQCVTIAHLRLELCMNRAFIACTSRCARCACTLTICNRLGNGYLQTLFSFPFILSGYVLPVQEALQHETWFIFCSDCHLICNLLSSLPEDSSELGVWNVIPYQVLALNPDDA